MSDADALRVLRDAADAAERKYERTAWIWYVAVWIPIPFAVWILRYHLEAWGYVIAGGLFLAVGAAIYAIDAMAVAKRDRAIEAYERAHATCDQAAQATKAG